MESSDIAGWQSFDLDGVLDSDQYLTKIKLTMKGTGSGAPGFRLLDARFIGTPIDNPTDSFNVRLETIFSLLDITASRFENNMYYTSTYRRLLYIV